MYKFKKSIINFLGLVTLSLSFNCQAEKWVHIENDFYMDVDSKIVEGDLTSIRMKTPKHGPSWVTFDCKRKLLLTDKGTITPKEQYLITACKKSWEIWK
jgi:hypothetical protein